MFKSIEDPDYRIAAIMVTLALGAILIFVGILAVYNTVDNAYEYGVNACQGVAKDV